MVISSKLQCCLSHSTKYCSLFQLSSFHISLAPDSLPHSFRIFHVLRPHARPGRGYPLASPRSSTHAWRNPGTPRSGTNTTPTISKRHAYVIVHHFSPLHFSQPVPPDVQKSSVPLLAFDVRRTPTFSGLSRPWLYHEGECVAAIR